MNFLHIALSGDVELFNNFVKQGLHKQEEVKIFYYRVMPVATSDAIFQHAIPEIQERYYKMYKEYVHTRAILYSNIDVPKVSLMSWDLNWLTQEQAIKVLASGKVIVCTHSLPDIKPEILKLLEPEHVETSLDEKYLVHVDRILTCNPKLESFFHKQLKFSVNKSYDYKVLAYLIKHDCVDFGTLHFNSNLVYHIPKIREYIPDFELPQCCYQYGTKFKCLVECINHGIYPTELLYPKDIDDRDSFYRCIKYLKPQCIIDTYLSEGWNLEDVVSQLEFKDVHVYLTSGSEIERLYALGSKCWHKIRVNLDVQLCDLTDQQLHQLEEIHSVMEFTIKPYDFHSLVLYYEFFNDPKPNKVEYIETDKELLDYKKGLHRLWKDVANQEPYVKLYCDHVPFVLATLDPPINVQLLDYKLVKRFCRNVSAKGSDINIICVE